MNKETIIISSKPIEVSEHDNYKEVTFLISVLDEYNLNNVLIEKAEGEKYHSTIIGYPIVAFLKYDKKGNPSDFGGHELRKKYNSKTKEFEYYFATFPIGSVTESWIEDREVDGYEGEKSCILIKTKLWSSRYPAYFEVFDKLWDEGRLDSSWEISVNESEPTDKGKKLLDFEFIGNCVLGSQVKGAVNGAGVLEVASVGDISYDELSLALSQDLEQNIENLNNLNITSSINENLNEEDNKINNNKQGGIENMSDTAKTIVNEMASMTDNDLYSKVRKAINATNTEKWYYIARLYPYEYRAVAYEWNQESQDDYVEFVYSVNSDETISITSQKDVKMVFVPKETIDTQLSEKDTKISELEGQIETIQSQLSEKETELSSKIEAITKLGEELSSKDEIITQKDTAISELAPFKEEADRVAEEKRQTEIAEKKENLKKLATKGGYISSEELESSEEIKKAIDELDEKFIKTIIAERVIEKLEQSDSNDEKNKDVETSNKITETASANLNNTEENMFSAVDIMKSILKRNK